MFLSLIGCLAVFVAVVGGILKLLGVISKKTMSEQVIANGILKRFLDRRFKSFMQFHSHIRFLSCQKGSLCIDYEIPLSACSLVNTSSSFSPSPDGENVVQHVCRNRAQLQLGGILAVADELTSTLCISTDKTHRAGVTVLLSGEKCFDDASVVNKNDYTVRSDDDDDVVGVDVNTGGGSFAGSVVRMEASAVKIGATIGFFELLVFETFQSTASNTSTSTTTATVTSPQEARTKGRLLYRVRHIKYLKMGIM